MMRRQSGIASITHIHKHILAVKFHSEYIQHHQSVFRYERRLRVPQISCAHMFGTALAVLVLTARRAVSYPTPRRLRIKYKNMLLDYIPRLDIA